MNNIKTIFLDNWFIKFNCLRINNYKKIIKEITWLSKIIETWKIYFDTGKTYLDTPYYWNTKLDFHNDWLGEEWNNPLYLFLKCNVKAKIWWENFFVDSKNILSLIPKEYFFLKYEFSLFGKTSIEKLFINHPVEWYHCLNFTLYWIDENWISNYIKFLWKTEYENKEICLFLYRLFENNKIILDLTEWERIIFDNYRFLHWRNWFTWYRELERLLVYL